MTTVCGDAAFTWRRISIPSPSGSLTSVMTMSTVPCAKTLAAAARLSATRTSNPSLNSMMASISRIDGSSSTTRIRFFKPRASRSVRPSTPRPGPKPPPPRPPKEDGSASRRGGRPPPPATARKIALARHTGAGAPSTQARHPGSYPSVTTSTPGRRAATATVRRSLRRSTISARPASSCGGRRRSSGRRVERHLAALVEVGRDHHAGLLRRSVDPDPGHQVGARQRVRHREHADGQRVDRQRLRAGREPVQRVLEAGHVGHRSHLQEPEARPARCERSCTRRGQPGQRDRREAGEVAVEAARDPPARRDGRRQALRVAEGPRPLRVPSHGRPRELLVEPLEPVLERIQAVLVGAGKRIEQRRAVAQQLRGGEPDRRRARRRRGRSARGRGRRPARAVEGPRAARRASAPAADERPGRRRARRPNASDRGRRPRGDGARDGPMAAASLGAAAAAGQRRRPPPARRATTSRIIHRRWRRLHSCRSASIPAPDSRHRKSVAGTSELHGKPEQADDRQPGQRRIDRREAAQGADQERRGQAGDEPAQPPPPDQRDDCEHDRREARRTSTGAAGRAPRRPRRAMPSPGASRRRVPGRRRRAGSRDAPTSTCSPPDPRRRGCPRRGARAWATIGRRRGARPARTHRRGRRPTRAGARRRPLLPAQDDREADAGQRRRAGHDADVRGAGQGHAGRRAREPGRGPGPGRSITRSSARSTHAIHAADAK